MKADFADLNSPPDLATPHSLPSKNLARLVWTMVRPYKKWLLIIFLATRLVPFTLISRFKKSANATWFNNNNKKSTLGA